MDVFPFNIFDLQGRGIAVLMGTGRVNALGHLNGKSDILHVKIAKGNVFHQTSATAAPVSIARCEDARALPGLDIGAIHCVLDGHILKRDIEIIVGHVWVLTDRADCDSSAAFAINILGVEIGCISLGCDTIVATDNGGIFHEQVVALPGIEPVGVHRPPLTVAGRIHEEVREGYILARPDKGRPKLRLDHLQSIDQEVGRVIDGHAHWSSCLVRFIPVGVVPRLALTIVEAAVAVEVHILTPKEPCRDLIL